MNSNHIEFSKIFKKLDYYLQEGYTYKLHSSCGKAGFKIIEVDLFIFYDFQERIDFIEKGVKFNESDYNFASVRLMVSSINKTIDFRSK